MRVGENRAIVASADPGLRQAILERLRSMNWPADEASGGAETVSLLESSTYDAVLLDRRLPDLDAAELGRLVEREYPDTDVVLLDCESSNPAEPRVARHVRTQQLSWLLRNSIEAMHAQPAPPVIASKTPPVQSVLPGVIGDAPCMHEVGRLVRLIASRRTAVLITGATGTGKEVIAEAVHRLSDRCDCPFVIVNCAAIPESLFESEVFGYARGAFTGAVQAKIGRIQAAHGGTLFLDEIGELPSHMQSKLLRFLQNGEVQRLGGVAPESADVRVIAATNNDICDPHPDHPFRRDLYYRLSVFPVALPLLRERGMDILLLGRHFTAQWCSENKVPRKALCAESEDLLTRHPWPGNVRELQHVIERACILAESLPVIIPAHLSLKSL